MTNIIELNGGIIQLNGEIMAQIKMVSELHVDSKIEGNSEALSFERVFQAVKIEFPDIIMEELISKSRIRNIVLPRQIMMSLYKEVSNASLKGVGMKFGNRDHSTVIHAIQAVSDLMETDREMRNIINSIRQYLGLEKRFDFA